MHVISAVLLFLSASGVRASEPVPLENFSGAASELGDAASASEVIFTTDQDLAYMPPENRPARLAQPLPVGALMHATLANTALAMPGVAAALSLIPPKAVSPAENAARFYGGRLVGAPSARGELSRISVGPGAAGAFMDGMSLQDIKDQATHIAVHAANEGGEFVARVPGGQFYRLRPELAVYIVTLLKEPHPYQLRDEIIHRETARGWVGLPTFRKEEGRFVEVRTQPSQPAVSAATPVQDFKPLSEAMQRLSDLMKVGLLMEAYRQGRAYLERLEAAGDKAARDEWKRRMELLFSEISERSERLSERFNRTGPQLIESPITFRDRR